VPDLRTEAVGERVAEVVEWVVLLGFLGVGVVRVERGHRIDVLGAVDSAAVGAAAAEQGQDDRHDSGDHCHQGDDLSPRQVGHVHSGPSAYGSEGFRPFADVTTLRGAGYGSGDRQAGGVPALVRRADTLDR
jgi:hypothetical protein